MADLADHAYAHAASVLGEGDAAVEVAITAVRRGGRSRWAVLGHARAGVLNRAAEAQTAELDLPAPEDLTELAVSLASTRPVIERVLVDLEARHDLDLGGFARALGLPVAHAAARAATVSAEWHALLDPVVLALLGPGECDQLVTILDPSDPALRSSLQTDTDDTAMDAATPSLRELMELAPAVADHADGCEACGDRLRSMVTVRTLLAQRPVTGTAPASVRAAAAPSRLRRPTPPPSLDPEPLARRWLRPLAIAGTAILVATAGGVVAALVRSGDDADRGHVEALTRVPDTGSALTVDPAALEGTTPPPVVLSNESDHAVRWVAEADVAWLQVLPAHGALGPAARTELRIGVTSAAPEGPARGAVRVSATDGSTTVVRLSTTVERPPEVAATATGCDISVTVEDEGEVRAVELHWTEGTAAERVVALPEGDAGYTGRIANSITSTTWWVTASDARGNVGRTPDENLTANTCP